MSERDVPGWAGWTKEDAIRALEGAQQALAGVRAEAACLRGSLDAERANTDAAVATAERVGAERDSLRAECERLRKEKSEAVASLREVSNRLLDIGEKAQGRVEQAESAAAALREEVAGLRGECERLLGITQDHLSLLEAQRQIASDARGESAAARQALARAHEEWTFPRQDSTTEQMRSVLTLTNDAKCYDAADVIRGWLEYRGDLFSALEAIRANRTQEAAGLQQAESALATATREMAEERRRREEGEERLEQALQIISRRSQQDTAEAMGEPGPWQREATKLLGRLARIKDIILESWEPVHGREEEADRAEAMRLCEMPAPSAADHAAPPTPSAPEEN